MRIPALVWCTLAYLFIGLGTAGIVLPLLPTTPFLLLALWAATRGSPRLAGWLQGHPRFGPYLCAWREERAIPFRAKVTACLLLTLSFVILWVGNAHPWLLAALAVLFSGVALFIVTRPNTRSA